MMIQHHILQSKSHSRQRGAALISVILLLGLLSALVTSFSVYVTNSATAIAIARDRITTKALVLSALDFGMGRVMSAEKGRPLPGSDKIRLQSGRASLQWRAETARLNINFVETNRLAPLLISLGLEQDQATELAKLIVARKTLKPSAPVPKDYIQLAGKKLGPYDHIRELRDIPGVTDALYRQLEPLLTVYGRVPQIDPRLADPALLQGLPNMSRPLLAELMSFSDLSDEDAQQRATSLGERADGFIFTPSNVIRFLIETETIGSGKKRFDIVVIHYPDDPQPYRILAWSEL